MHRKLLPTAYCLLPQKGFTLIELVITLAIFGMMTVAILGNYPKFNSKIAVELLAQNIALSIRQAQVYGISIRSSDVDLDQLAPAYGIHFLGATTNLTQMGPLQQEYVLFKDTNPIDNSFWNPALGGNLYEGGVDWGGTGDCLASGGGVGGAGDARGECVQGFLIKGRVGVGLVCANLQSDTTRDMAVKIAECRNDPMLHSDIVFRRPNPEAKISGWRQSNTYEPRISDLNVFIHPTDGTSDRLIVIWSTGQISVQRCNATNTICSTES